MNATPCPVSGRKPERPVRYRDVVGLRSQKQASWTNSTDRKGGMTESLSKGEGAIESLFEPLLYPIANVSSGLSG